MIGFESLQDAEGVLVANIGSYMGGVDLWQNEDESYDNFDPQSMHDKILEVVSISGTWHLGKLQVNWFLICTRLLDLFWSVLNKFYHLLYKIEHAFDLLSLNRVSF